MDEIHWLVSITFICNSVYVLLAEILRVFYLSTCEHRSSTGFVVFVDVTSMNLLGSLGSGALVLDQPQSEAVDRCEPLVVFFQLHRWEQVYVNKQKRLFCCSMEGKVSSEVTKFNP